MNDIMKDLGFALTWLVKKGNLALGSTAKKSVNFMSN